MAKQSITAIVDAEKTEKKIFPDFFEHNFFINKIMRSKNAPEIKRQSDISIPTIFPMLKIFATMGVKKTNSKNVPDIKNSNLKNLFIISPLLILNNGSYRIIDGV
ncbi:MAG: hypothetical protein ACI4V4_00430 [Eubacterium sp.]